MKKWTPGAPIRSVLSLYESEDKYQIGCQEQQEFEATAIIH